MFQSFCLHIITSITNRQNCFCINLTSYNGIKISLPLWKNLTQHHGSDIPHRILKGLNHSLKNFKCFTTSHLSNSLSLDICLILIFCYLNNIVINFSGHVSICKKFSQDVYIVVNVAVFRTFQFTAAAAKSLQSCPTLCDPIDGSPLGSAFLGFSRQEHWSGLPFPSPMHESEVAQSCLTLRDPMDCSQPGSSVHRIFQARVLEWVAIAFSVPIYRIPLNYSSKYWYQSTTFILINPW